MKPVLEVHREPPVIIPSGRLKLEGELHIPDQARGLVLFVHGSGSSRVSPRSQFVARRFQEGGLATLQFDLLTLEEEVFDFQTANYRFDIGLLTGRLFNGLDWTKQNPALHDLKIGLFASSTGAGAALVAAAARPEAVSTVVARGGRPDLAFNALSRVLAPTLLIVGARDERILELNLRALHQLKGVKQLEIIPDATHLFEEPGALEKVAQLATTWFQKHLSPS